MADPNADYVNMSVEEYTHRWDERWKKNYTPWDMGEPAPGLIHLFKQDTFGDSGTALVPGCGTGYEVNWISSYKNWSAVGIDVSEKAIQVASSQAGERATFLVKDFFALEQQFDLAFDHLFLCALQPKQRLDWAKKYGSIIKPAGKLVTYIWPINAEKKDGIYICLILGPPFALSLDLCKELLQENFTLEYAEKPVFTYEKRVNGEHQELIAIWSRK